MFVPYQSSLAGMSINVHPLIDTMSRAEQGQLCSAFGLQSLLFLLHFLSSAFLWAQPCILGFLIYIFDLVHSFSFFSYFILKLWVQERTTQEDPSGKPIPYQGRGQLQVFLRNKISPSSNGAFHAPGWATFPGLQPPCKLHPDACSDLEVVPQSFLFLLVLNYRTYWIIHVHREAALVFLFWYREQWPVRLHCWSVLVILFSLSLWGLCSVHCGSRSIWTLENLLLLVSCLVNVRRCEIALWSSYASNL